ncbi:MAG: AAA family ATPase [Patescibacteria group bacterium]
MYLQRIELQGFKSFAQKTVLEFPAPGKNCSMVHGRQASAIACGVTTIVGPNGSGKSNIVDAVRWVLGEQSLKLLRGKKATDVIFSGSAKKSQMGLAEVSLHLNNEDKSAPIDYGEVVITRKLYRDGSSEYRLNKGEVRLFDIIMLLAKANFGQNTYSVIGQGMIDRIVNYSSSERKDFFDEATGVKQYQIKREKSVNKLKKARENMVQVRALVQELEPHLRSLTRQVSHWRKRREVEAELRDSQVKYYGKLWFNLDSAYQGFALDFIKTEKEKIKLENKIRETEAQLTDLSQERGRVEEFNQLQSIYDRQLAKRNNLLQQLAEIKGKLNVEYLKIGKPDLTWLENRKDELDLQIKDINNEMAALDKQIVRLADIFKERHKKQEKALGEFKDFEDRLLQLQKEFQSDLGVSEKEVRQAVNRIYSRQKDFIYKLKITHSLDGLTKLKVEAEAVFSEVEVFYNKISQPEKRRQSEEMISLQNQLSEFLKNKDSLVNEINEIKIKLEVAVSQKKSLQVKAAGLDNDLVKVNNDLKKNKIIPANKEKFSEALQKDKAELQEQIKEAENEFSQIKDKIKDFNEHEEQKKQRIFALQQETHNNQSQLNSIISFLNEIKIEIVKIETKKEDLFVAMRQDLGHDYRPKIEREFQGVNIEELAWKITKLKKQLALIGGTDPEVEKEYNEVKERHNFLSRQNEDIEKAIKDLEKIVAALDKMIKKQFESEFKRINEDFSRYFKQLFEGGSAKLVLSQKEVTEAEAVREEAVQLDNLPLPEGAGPDSSPPARGGEADAQAAAEGVGEGIHLEDKSFLANMGIDIEACPPGKKIKNINMLSGGEKTMTALALICAIISNNPSPFILFDEVDAALDEANSSKFSNIINELSHKTQFIIITHNRAIMAKADVLYGVTMQGDGISRLISLKLEEAEKMTK